MSATAASEQWLEWARDALFYYGMSEAQVEWLAHTHNAVFDVRHADNHYVLRLCRHADNRWDNLYGELSCLAEIRKASSLVVPQVVEIAAPENVMRASKGAWRYMSGILTNNESEPEKQIHAVLFHYIDGEKRTPAHLTTLDIKRVGKFLAQLHDITAKAEGSKADSLRNALAFRPALNYDGLFGVNSRYHPGEGAAMFTPEQKQIMGQVQQKVKAAMDAIGTGISDFGLIHGDMLLPNILFHEGDVRALDFEYCGPGYYLYDLTPLLWHLKPEERYQTFEDALWDGYTAVRPLPRRDLLETFIAARHIASMRWTVINHDHPFVAGKALEILEHRTDGLLNFLEQGRITRRYD